MREEVAEIAFVSDQCNFEAAALQSFIWSDVICMGAPTAISICFSSASNSTIVKLNLVHTTDSESSDHLPPRAKKRHKAHDIFRNCLDSDNSSPKELFFVCR